MPYNSSTAMNNQFQYPSRTRPSGESSFRVSSRLSTHQGFKNVESFEIQDLGRENKKNQVETQMQWNPSYGAHFPYLGLGCLFLVFLSAVAAAIVLVVSNNKTVTQWPRPGQLSYLTPSVLLAFINMFANLSLLVGAQQGFAIAWWRKTLKGATINELHQNWRFTWSMFSVFSELKLFNRIAIAAIAMKLAFVDGIFLQRATSSRNDLDPNTRSVEIGTSSVQTFPYTGVVTNGKVTAFSYGFTKTVNGWQESSTGLLGPILQNADGFPGCTGVCEVIVPSAGFVWNCSSTSQANVNYGDSTHLSTPNLPVFSTAFTIDWARAGKEYASIIYTGQQFAAASSGSCVGSLSSTTCELRPALLDAWVTVSDYDTQNRVDLGWSVGSVYTHTESNPNQQDGFKFESYIDINEDGTALNSRIGGVALLLQQYYGSTATITYNNSGTWTLSQEGWYAQTQNGRMQPESCNYNFADPTQTIFKGINALTFAMGVDVSTFPDSSWGTTPTTNSKVSAQQTTKGLLFRTSMPFTVVAVLVMILSAVAMLPLYWGYWELGRRMSLAPFEIGNAMNTPTLQGSGLEEILRRSGNVKMLFGEVRGKMILDREEIVRNVE